MAQKKKNGSLSTKKDKAALYIRVSTVYQIDKDSLKVLERELVNYTKLVRTMKFSETQGTQPRIQTVRITRK